ncbi:nuclear transport factor 2 family protein [Dokdonella fugitiva]|uniref:nuclear transport factor 2 family protein n=1 Tax=Dokdonella fugitiva TaxID=328517 RepID=UPI0018305947|nr:nuclear transport factor 2 family protein [Dokdonella fugitiva]MBA8884551.1 hypothetical protein [Dokdonella fugitiva]
MPMHEHDRRRMAPSFAAASVPAAAVARTDAAGPAHAAGAVGPRDQLAIVDALYRFGAGQDLRDRALFASAFAADATLDFSQPAGRFGVALAPFAGRGVIVETIFAAIAALDTTHTVTNPRITGYDGERAGLFALVEAQHLPRGDHRRHLLLKNIYHVDLVRHDGLWLIEHMRIDNVWSAGDPTVLFANAPVAATEENPHG